MSRIRLARPFSLWCAIALGLVSWICGVTASGQERETPIARHIELDGQPNFRDVGGYRTKDGRVVKWRQVFRSGELSGLSDDDVETLDVLGTRSVVNFLTEKEIRKAGEDRLPEGVKRIPSAMESGNMGELASVVLEARRTGDFSEVPASINPTLHRLLMKEGREHYAALLRDIADPENRPIVFHCSHGIHRTGTATAILLSALGVPWETVREDYLLSNDCRGEEVVRRIEELKRLAAAHSGVPLDKVDDSNIRAFYVLDGAYIDASLDAAVKEYGSMDGYIRDGLGLTDGEIKRLRDELLEPSK